jgi:signal peptide peptidase SppA
MLLPDLQDSNVRQCDRIVSAIARQPWAITPDGLELVLGIAQRRINDREAVLAAPLERRESGSVRMRDGVAVISVMGTIFPRANYFTDISGATSIETLALHFGEAVAAADIKAVVLHIDSPGGQITGVHEFAERIFAARDIKPVVAYISGMGTSAAYWIACAAGRVVADATASLGSIGVVTAWTDDKEARKSRGLTDYEIVSSQSPNKRLDPAGREGRAAIQRQLDETADIFIADVARYRGESIVTVKEDFGRGGIMLAAEAVKVGMADAIGSLEEVIAELAGSGGPAGTYRGGKNARITKETHMDKDELAEKHPELLAQIQAEARAEAEKALADGHQKQLEAAALNTAALMSIVAGKEAAEQVAKLSAAGFTAKQLEAVASMLAVKPAPESGAKEGAGESAGRAEILAALRGATPAPVAALAKPKNDDSIMATVDRISAIGA